MYFKRSCRFNEPVVSLSPALTESLDFTTISASSGISILTEEVAPNDYNKVDTAIKFHVAEDGKVTLTGTYSTGEVVQKTDGTIVLKDTKKEIKPEDADDTYTEDAKTVEEINNMREQSKALSKENRSRK